MNEQQNETVYSVTGRMIRLLESKEKAGEKDTALLAALRNSAGKPLIEAADIWPFLFEHLPREFLSETGKPTAEELAICTALQIYAVCKQGTGQNLRVSFDRGLDLGRTLGSLREVDQSKALDRRFNAMITSATYEELVYHLRQMVKLVRAKGNADINYSRLADDLYCFQKGQRNGICFRWSTGYYSGNMRKAGTQSTETGSAQNKETGPSPGMGSARTRELLQ